MAQEEPHRRAVSPPQAIGDAALEAPQAKQRGPIADHRPGRTRQRHGNRESRDGERDREGEGHRQCERLEKSAHHAGEKRERQEDDDGRQARSHQRRQDLREAARGRIRRDGFLAVPVDVLDHHDRVVGDEPERGGDACERHQIERLPEEAEPESDDGHAERDGDDRDGREPQAAQEEEQDQPCEDNADEDGVAHAGDRVRNVPGLIVEGGPLHAFRQKLRTRTEEVVDRLGDGDGIGIRLADDVHQHGGLVLRGGADVRNLVGDVHLAEVAERSGDTVRDRYRELAQGVDAVRATVHERQVELVIGLGEAGREDLVVGADGGDDVAGRQVPRLERGAIELDLELALPPAAHDDARDSRNAKELRLQRVIGQLAKLELRRGIRSERVPEDGEHRRIHPLHVDAGLGRQVRADALHLRLRALERRLHVRAPAELRRELDRSARGGRPHERHAGDPQ